LGLVRSSILRAVLVVGAVTVAAGAIRVHGLSAPHRKVFDEVYYASDGCRYAGVPFADCDLDTDSERSWVHPPLGKMLIAAGIDPPGPIPGYGNRPFGWRIAAAAAGTMSVALVGVLAFLLWRSAVWAGAASLLLAIEHLHFVHSRISMLDIFLAFFVILGFTLLVADRVRADRRAGLAVDPPPPDPGRPREPGVEHDLDAPLASWPSPTGAPTVTEAPAEAPRQPAPPASHRRSGVRWLRLAAGAALGAATAVKWSGVLALAGAVILAVVWERSRRVRQGVTRPWLRALREEGLGLYLAFLVVPLLAYAVTWIPWLAERGFDLGEWVGHHGSMAGYHFGLETVKDDGEPTHPYMSRAWGWLLLARPVAYYWRGEPDCCAEILGIGSPFLFWGALITLPYLALSWRSRRDWRAGVALVPILTQYLPWLAISRPLFLFYMVPVTPFLALAMAYVLRDVAEVRLGNRRMMAVAAAVIVVGVGIFAFFWPVLTGATVPKSVWEARMWFGSWI
jgi:dolichyl-phosphate-mannose-protein mannosyltransferase